MNEASERLVPAPASRYERSLLLFFEASAVYWGGLVNGECMSTKDHAIARRWSVSGYVTFGRLKIDEARGLRGKTYWVVLSDAAHCDAAEERAARAKRSMHPLVESRMNITEEPTP